MIESGRRDPRKLVCLARLDAFPLPLGYRHMGDQAGFEPAMGIASGLRVRPVRRYGNWSMEDASGYDPHAYGLKVRSLSIRV